MTMVLVTITDAERKLSHGGTPYVNLRLTTPWGQHLWSFIAFHQRGEWYWKRVLGSLLNEYEWLALALATRPLDPDDRFFLAEEVIPHLIGKSTTVSVTNVLWDRQVRQQVKWWI